MHVSLDHLHKSFASTGEILRDVSVEIETGAFVTLLGPSGCGKSTLLRLIADLEHPSSGAIRLDGQPSSESDGKSFVFQEPRLLPWRTALANVALPLELRGTDRAERLAQSGRGLEAVGLGDNLKTYPDELSGGMRMRVSLARALVTRPRLLLLDEPFGALDEITRQALNDELLRLWRADRWTAIFVTHNVFEAVFLSQRVLVMGRNPGHIHADIEVPFAYPRQDALRGDPAFATLVARLMTTLQEASR